MLIISKIYFFTRDSSLKLRFQSQIGILLLKPVFLILSFRKFTTFLLNYAPNYSSSINHRYKHKFMNEQPQYSPSIIANQGKTVMYLSAFDRELIKLNPIRLQKLDVRLRVGFRTQVSIRGTRKGSERERERNQEFDKLNPRRLNSTYTIDRIPRDCKKLKLAELGKPDLKTPLSTMAKFRGGTNSSSSSLSLSPPVAGAFAVGKTADGRLITVPVSPSELSTFIAIFSRQIFY